MKAELNKSIPNLSALLDRLKQLVSEGKLQEARAEIRDWESSGQNDLCLEEHGCLLYLASSVFHNLGDYPKALEFGLKAQEIFQDLKDQIQIAHTHALLSDIYKSLGDIRNAEIEAWDALSLYRQINFEKGVISSYNKLAGICHFKSEYSKAIEFLNEAIAICKRINDRKTLARLLGNTGEVYRLLGKWDEAEEYLVLNIKANQENGDEINLARGELSLGYIYYLKRNFEKAEELYHQAKVWIDKQNSLRDLAIYYEFAGELAVAYNQYEKAHSFYSQALEIGNHIAPEGDICSQTYRLLAELFLKQKKFTEAFLTAQKASEISTLIDEKFEQAATYRVLGEIFFYYQDHKIPKHFQPEDLQLPQERMNSEDCFYKAIEGFQKIGSRFELAKTYLSFGQHSELSYFERLKPLVKAEDIFKDVKAAYYLAKTNLAICQLLIEHKDPEKALVFLEEAEKASSLFSIDEQETVNELNARLQNLAGRIPPLTERFSFPNIVTRNQKFQEILNLASQFKESDISIFLEGETGVGKDLLASTIHYSSKRKDKKLIVVNCAAIPETLLESQLFGYKKGAFTGADKDKPGLFEFADGGTFYLDEIADAPLSIQAKLLRVLESKEVVRLGDLEPRKIDVRFIASTNRDIASALQKGTFRHDLYYRLAVLNLNLPPLRERKEDIPLLVEFFFRQHRVDPAGFDKRQKEKLFEVLMLYDWPGNIRELENEIKKAIVLAGVKDENILKLIGERFDTYQGENGFKGSLPFKVAEYEKNLIIEALKQAGWVKSKAARLLGVPESTLRHKIEGYAIKEI